MPLLFIFMAWWAEDSLPNDSASRIAQGLAATTLFILLIFTANHDA